MPWIQYTVTSQPVKGAPQISDGGMVKLLNKNKQIMHKLDWRTVKVTDSNGRAMRYFFYHCAERK